MSANKTCAVTPRCRSPAPSVHVASQKQLAFLQLAMKGAQHDHNTHTGDSSKSKHWCSSHVCSTTGCLCVTDVVTLQGAAQGHIRPVCEAWRHPGRRGSDTSADGSDGHEGSCAHHVPDSVHHCRRRRCKHVRGACVEISHKYAKSHIEIKALQLACRVCSPSACAPAALCKPACNAACRLHVHQLGKDPS